MNVFFALFEILDLYPILAAVRGLSPVIITHGTSAFRISFIAFFVADFKRF